MLCPTHHDSGLRRRQRDDGVPGVQPHVHAAVLRENGDHARALVSGRGRLLRLRRRHRQQDAVQQLGRVDTSEKHTTGRTTMSMTPRTRRARSTVCGAQGTCAQDTGNEIDGRRGDKIHKVNGVHGTRYARSVCRAQGTHQLRLRLPRLLRRVRRDVIQQRNRLLRRNRLRPQQS